MPCAFAHDAFGIHGLNLTKWKQRTGTMPSSPRDFFKSFQRCSSGVQYLASQRVMRNSSWPTRPEDEGAPRHACPPEDASATPMRIAWTYFNRTLRTTPSLFCCGIHDAPVVKEVSPINFFVTPIAVAVHLCVLVTRPLCAEDTTAVLFGRYIANMRRYVANLRRHVAIL